MLLDAATTSLLLIDIQEKLLPAMAAPERVLSRTAILLQSARELGIPVAVSEQYPKGLGHTVPELAGNDARLFEKLHFSCWKDPDMRKHLINLHEHGRPLVLVAGIEAHVCVLQTCIDLAAAGFGVFVVADAVSARSQASVDLALSRARHAGVEVINTEMAVFELLEKAGTPAFKALAALIK